MEDRIIRARDNLLNERGTLYPNRILQFLELYISSSIVVKEEVTRGTLNNRQMGKFLLHLTKISPVPLGQLKYDKGFLKKYDQDLNTTLIFVGSPSSSAQFSTSAQPMGRDKCPPPRSHSQDRYYHLWKRYPGDA